MHTYSGICVLNVQLLGVLVLYEATPLVVVVVLYSRVLPTY